MAHDDRFSARVFNLVILALLGYVLFRIFEPFFAPIVWAFLIAFLLFPLNRKLRRLVGGRSGVAAILLTLGVMLGIVLPAVVGTVAFAGQATDLAHSLTEWANRYQISGVQDILRLPVLGNLMSWLEKNFALDAARIQAWGVQAAQAAVQLLLTYGRQVLLGALGFFGNLVLMLFVLFFFFRDGDAMAERAKKLIPLEASRKERLDGRLQDVTRAVVSGTVVTALVQGALIGIGFWITGIPSPLVFGTVAAVASFIPLVGTGLVWVPAVLYLWAQGVVWKTIFLAVWSALIVGSADNFLKPLLVSGKAKMSTLTVLFGVLGGLAAFGMIGLFLGPVILALVIALMEFAEEKPATS